MRNRVPDEAGLRLAGSAEPSKVDPGRPVSGLTTLLTINLQRGLPLSIHCARHSPAGAALTFNHYCRTSSSSFSAATSPKPAAC